VDRELAGHTTASPPYDSRGASRLETQLCYCCGQPASRDPRASCAALISPTRSAGGLPAACICSITVRYNSAPISLKELTCCIRSTMYCLSAALESVYPFSSNFATISSTSLCWSSYLRKSSFFTLFLFLLIQPGNLSCNSFIGSYKMSLLVNCSIMLISIFENPSSSPVPSCSLDCISFSIWASISSESSEAAAAAQACSPEFCILSMVFRIVSWKPSSPLEGAACVVVFSAPGFADPESPGSAAAPSSCINASISLRISGVSSTLPSSAAIWSWSCLLNSSAAASESSPSAEGLVDDAVNCSGAIRTSSSFVAEKSSRRSISEAVGDCHRDFNYEVYHLGHPDHLRQDQSIADHPAAVCSYLMRPYLMFPLSHCLATPLHPYSGLEEHRNDAARGSRNGHWANQQTITDSRTGLNRGTFSLWWGYRVGLFQSSIRYRIK